jgi:hypothetical protein
VVVVVVVVVVVFVVVVVVVAFGRDEAIMKHTEAAARALMA